VRRRHTGRDPADETIRNLTPTSEPFQKKITKVAPVDIDKRRVSQRT